MNRKKGRDATVDINDSNNGDPVKIFIVQVAALSWAATQVPEITAAIQSFLNAGFRSAAQVEFVVMIGGLHPGTKATRFQSFRNFVPKHAGTGFWHELYSARGGFEAVYVDVQRPIGFLRFANAVPAKGSLFSARERLHRDGVADTAAPHTETDPER